MLAFAGRGTSFQTDLLVSESISSCSALLHWSANGDFIAARCVIGYVGVDLAWLMCVDKSVRYGRERSPTDRCAVLPRSLLAISSDIAALLRVIGGLDLPSMLLC